VFVVEFHLLLGFERVIMVLPHLRSYNCAQCSGTLFTRYDIYCSFTSLEIPVILRAFLAMEGKRIPDMEAL
jgi:hypothetical protein